MIVLDYREYEMNLQSEHMPYNGWLFKATFLTAGLCVIMTQSHVTSDTRPSHFSVCNIENWEWPGNEATRNDLRMSKIFLREYPQPPLDYWIMVYLRYTFRGLPPPPPHGICKWLFCPLLDKILNPALHAYLV